MWVLRVFIGGIFIVSGLSKILGPYQNFLYVIQAYQLLPSGLEVLTAQIFPWMEFMVGSFVVLGLWTRWSLAGAGVLFGILVGVVGQALLRGLPLESCGCFGAWIHVKPQTVIVMDSFSLLLTLVLLRRLPQAEKFSADSYFDKL
ncbi:MAG: DoxX family membrane protein [Candidatus Omnitrophica bacterium]|nr:DoxX family membrane protein [Candidatus Omnitrophota bacterium]